LPKGKKPEALISRLIELGSDEGDLVLDFFTGTGTTAAVAQKMNRRWIAVESAQFFSEKPFKRMNRVLQGEGRGISKNVGWKGGGFFKFIRLESYEDTLNNIEFDDASGQQALEFDDYLIKYMLKWETKHSETLLNLEKLVCPFTYRLHSHADGQTHGKVVDVSETFNYLLGLHVQSRRVYDDSGRRYLVYCGQIRDGRRVVVIWRETEGWQKADLERDREFVAEQKLTESADEVFVNGDSFIPNARALEPVFKARMFAQVEV